MELFDRIELRRFVGREFLLWLWFESELFEATLSTKAHGEFGLWLEGRLVLSQGREVTTIRGSAPGNHREAKESLRRGKLSELASLHLSWADHEATLTLKGDRMAIASLVLPAVLKEEEPVVDLATRPAPRPRRKGRSRSAAEEGEAEADEAAESFYERMRLARDVEAIVEALYEDFLALRLGEGWGGTVVPALTDWVAGNEVDADAYRAARLRLLGRGARSKRA